MTQDRARYRRLGLAVVCAAPLLAQGTGCAWAAPTIEPSQVTPPLEQLPERQPRPEVSFPAIVPPRPPSDADAIELNVGEVTIAGGSPQLAPTTEAIKSRLAGHTMSLAAVYAAAGELERAYAAAGFPLTRVTVPPQRIVPGGPLRLMVIEGYIERVDLAGVPARYRGYVWKCLERLVGKRGVTQDEIERAVLLAGDAKGLTLKSAIAAGNQPGGAKLIVEGAAALVSGTVSVDNKLPNSLGTWESTVALALNSPLGFGEQVTLLLGAALDRQPGIGLHGPLDVVGVGLSVPLGDDGATLAFGYTHSTTRPTPNAATPSTVGTFDRASLTVEYPWIRSRQDTISTNATLDYIEQANRVPFFATDLSRDRYAALRLGATWLHTDLEPPQQQWQAHWQLSQGIGGRGAADASYVPLSRLGASPYFTRFDIDAQATQPLGQDFSLRLFARGQYSFGAPVFVSEQFALDTTDGVSGFASGTFSVDSGVTLRAEIAKAIVTELPAVSILWSPYAFADVGKGWLFRSTALESASPIVGSFGLGVRLGTENGIFQDANLEIEFAHHLSDIAGARHGNRFTIEIGKKF